MKIKLFILLLIFTTPVSAYDWTVEHTAWLGLTVDYFQTREISRNPEFTETNQYLGRAPDLGQVNRYFATLSIIHGIARQTKYGNYVSWYFVIYHVPASIKNYKIGIRADW